MRLSVVAKPATKERLEAVRQIGAEDVVYYSIEDRAAIFDQFGAFVERELVGDLFLSFASNEFGCLDQVETSPKFRRKGIATKLLAFASEMTLRHLGSKRMLVEADIDSAGSATYQRFGFRPIEVVASLEEAFVR